MSWTNYYNKNLDYETFIKVVYSHIDFFNSIMKEKPKNVLEIGVGAGITSIFLSYLGLNITAIDNDKKLIKQAKKNIKALNGKVNLVFADAFHLPFPDNYFDLVCHQGFFEHFKDVDISQLLKEQLRVAKKVVFSVPNNYYPSRDYGNERLLSKRQWDQILLDFKIEESKNYFIFCKNRFSLARPIMYLAKVTRR